MIINFVAFENTTFSLTIDTNDDADFEGFHSFVISLPTDSNYIVPLGRDTANTTVTISDFDGEINHMDRQNILWLSLFVCHNFDSDMLNILITSDATVSVSSAVVTGDEGTNVTVCTSVTDTSPGTIVADIELSFKLVPDTAGMNGERRQRERERVLLIASLLLL